MNTLSILIDDIATALTKACGYDIFIHRHDGFNDEGQAIPKGLFGFRSTPCRLPTETEYTYLGYQAFVNRIR